MTKHDDVDYKSLEYVNSLLKRINAEVGAIIAENAEKMREIYGTSNPTVEMILEKLYAESPGRVEKALAIKVLLRDVYDSHKLSLPLLTYNIGVLRALLAGAPEAEQTPLEDLLEDLENLSESDEHLVRKRLGEKAIKKRWAPRDEALAKVKAEARKRWSKWKQKGGQKIYHNKMADVFLEEMSEELSEAGVTRQMLIKALKEVAKEIDPTLIYGIG
jgi:hypothetical protein